MHGLQNNITPKPASIFSDDNGVGLSDRPEMLSKKLLQKFKKKKNPRIF